MRENSIWRHWLARNTIIFFPSFSKSSKDVLSIPSSIFVYLPSPSGLGVNVIGYNDKLIVEYDR